MGVSPTTMTSSRGKDTLHSSSALSMATAGAALFPNLVPALQESHRSLTLFNSSSSELTLKTMLILALIGMPLVIGYTIWVYWSFAGRLTEDEGYGPADTADPA